MLLNRVILKYCTEEAGKEAFACARTPRLRLRLRLKIARDVGVAFVYSQSK